MLRVSTFMKGLLLAAMLVMAPWKSPFALAVETGKNITILGGGPGGPWGIISEGVGETIRRSFPDIRVTAEPGKDGPNQVMVSRNEVPFALGSDVLTLRALKGEAPFKGRQLSNLRLVAVMNPTTVLHFLVNAEIGVKNINEIKDRKIPLRVSVNRQGTLMDVGAEAILQSYGISYKDIEDWGGKVHKIPGPESLALWGAGQLDGSIDATQIPHSRYIEMAQKHEVRLLPLDPENQKHINEVLGTYSLTIPAGTYTFQKEDCPTVSAQLVLLTSAEQSDEVVTTVLKAMTENIDYLHNIHSNLRVLSPEVMSSNTTLPMHPAAQKFFQEMKK